MPGNPDDKTFQDKAAAALQNMSIADKANQMRGTDPGPSAANRNWTDIFRQPNDDKNSLKGFTFRDGPRGVNLDAPIKDTNIAHAKSTVFPVSMARGAAWDIDLEYRIGQAIGDEMVAAKQNVMLGPTINLLRHPLWGRAQETYGEDPYQLGRLGTAHVAGVQQYVIACPKHFLGNNIENLRESKNAQMDDQTLHEIYGRHFEMTIQDGGAACIMSAYNLVNGKKCTQNAAVLNDLLRKDFGFKGFVLTDWWAMPGGSGGSPNASNMAEAIKAGNDIELPWNWHYSTIESAIGSSITQTDVDTAVKRILAQKFRFSVDKGTGLKATTSSVSDGSVSSSDHEKIALEAAEKSMVLLKNEKNTLPIASSVKKIAVLGVTQSYDAATETSPGINNKADDVNGGTIDFAKGVRVGDVGSSRVNFDKSKAVGPFDGIKAAAGSATVVAGSSANDAKDADFIVVVAGLTPYDEGEEYNKSGDRTKLILDGKDNGRGNAGTQEKLIKEAAALGKPMVVILEGGSVIDISAWESSVPAIVMAWYPGMAGGTAMGELLFGKKNFSGKLPISWPKTLSDLPDFNPGTSATMDYYVGYRYYDKEKKEPRFPFGYGLSYTKYEYGNLSLPCADATTSAVVKVSVDVSNKGSVDGEEVVLLFVSYPDTKAKRPIKELKGFARVSVPAGGKKTVQIPLRVSDLKYWNSTDKKWVVETGAVKVQVGPSSADLPLSGTFSVK
jgi:beta-glucosidase